MNDRGPISQFRRFLKEQPQPALLRLDENEKKTIKINHRVRSCWSDAEKSVVAMDATLVEALDNQGNILRAFKLKDDAAQPEKPPQQEAWPDAPEAQLAQIITAACDRAASRHEAAYRMSFERLSAMFEATVGRMEDAMQRAAQAEARLERERRQWLEAQLKAAGSPGDDDEPSIGGLIGALVEANVAKQMGLVPDHSGSNGKVPNGKDA